MFSGSWAVRDTPDVWVWNLRSMDRSSCAPNLSLIRCAQSLLAALNLATSSRKSICAQKKNESRRAKSSTLSPRSRALSMYVIALANVNATSCTAVAPASRMWYPLMLMGFHLGISLEQNSIRSIVSLRLASGGKM